MTVSAPVSLRQCPACGSSTRRDLPVYSLDEWRVCACGDCGFVYLSNPPAYDRLKDEFAFEKTSHAHSVRRKKKMPVVSWLDRKTRWRLHILRPNEAQEFRSWFRPGNVLDIGCGSGHRVPEPFTPFGIEASAYLAAKADQAMKERGGACVCAPAVDGVAQFDAHQFSAVVMRSFLEHEVQPQVLLNGVFRILQPDGVAFVKVPNYGGLNRRVMGRSWCGFRYPDHVNYFTLNSLRAMAFKAGFSLRLLNPLNLALDDNIHALLRKPAQGPASVR